ncbi:MAG: transcription termination/antitermination protein NusG [Patescibacteria group bacterium]|nr:MAG: transcription termination/antitermination protein NusG [Patescibacteria group bacterium]
MAEEKETTEKKLNEAKSAKLPRGGGGLSREQSSEAHWFVVHTYSGHERKVIDALKQRIEALGLKDKIQEVFIPTQEKIIIDAGKKKTIRERLFPGYVMVKMVLSDETWGIVRNTAGVTGFVGTGSRPTPLPPHEVDAILKFTKMEAPKFELKFKVGETIKVIDGPFNDFLGKVDEIDEEKGKVKVLVSVFGRETPVELDFLQVSRL